METLNIATFTTIIALCYFIGFIAKQIPAIKNNYIPLIVGASGAILGIIGYFTIPDYPASDLLTAISVGVASGLTSTGVDQLVKKNSRERMIKVGDNHRCDSNSHSGRIRQ